MTHVMQETGPYTVRPIEERAFDPLHASVKELIDECSSTRHILDLGCSDGVATWGMDNVEVIGVDFDQSLLAQARYHNPDYRGVCANITDLPFTTERLTDVDTVLMLDVLEHVEWNDAVASLHGLRKLLPAEHTIIASIPICSPLSVETARESLGVLKNRRRPDAGIFDKTHRIFTGRKGHHNLFADGGYHVVDEFQTNHIEGVTGEWQWKDKLEGPYLIDLLRKRRQEENPTILRAAQLATSAYVKLTSGSSPAMRRFGQSLFAYQGLYVAKPTQGQPHI